MLEANVLQCTIHAQIAMSSAGQSFRSDLYCLIQEKSNVVEQLDKEKQKKGEQLQQAHADLARQAALIKDLQSHAKKKDNKQAGVAAEQVCIQLPFHSKAHLLHLGFPRTAQHTAQHSTGFTACPKDSINTVVGHCCVPEYVQYLCYAGQVSVYLWGLPGNALWGQEAKACC